MNLSQPQYNYKKIGITALMFIIPISILLTLFLPLAINWILSYYDKDDRQIYSEYNNIVNVLSNGELWLILLLVIQAIAMLLGIWYYGPKLAYKILALGKRKFSSSFVAVISIWFWILCSLLATIFLSQIFLYSGNKSIVDNVMEVLFFCILFVFIPYLILSLVHSLIFSFFVGQTITKLSKYPSYIKNT